MRLNLRVVVVTSLVGWALWVLPGRPTHEMKGNEYCGGGPLRGTHVRVTGEVRRLERGPLGVDVLLVNSGSSGCPIEVRLREAHSFAIGDLVAIEGLWNGLGVTNGRVTGINKADMTHVDGGSPLRRVQAYTVEPDRNGLMRVALSPYGEQWVDLYVGAAIRASIREGTCQVFTYEGDGTVVGVAPCGS